MSQEGLLEALLQQSGDCCTLSSAAAVVMARVKRLFFMSERQDLSRFLVTDLGITRYPEYRQIFCFLLLNDHPHYCCAPRFCWLVRATAWTGP